MDATLHSFPDAAVMYWDAPQWLFLMWVLPLLAVLFGYARHKQLAAAHRFTESAMLGKLLPSGGEGRLWSKSVACLLGVALLIAAAARPRWGIYYEEVQSRGADLFVLLDVSKSMLAEDVAPNRLTRAKSDILDLLLRLRGDRVGLIAFAGAAVVQSPLTTDQKYFRNILEDTDPESAPRGGSLIGDAIRKALASMEPQADRDQVIVLITDGEDHDSFPEEAARQASQRKVKIICVGLGDSQQGRRIPLRDEMGRLNYLKHDGQEVWSKMDEDLLREIALTTQGAYIPARTRDYDLGQVYDRHLSGLRRGQIEAVRRKRYHDRFPLFITLGLAALLLEMAIPRYPRSDIES